MLDSLALDQARAALNGGDSALMEQERDRLLRWHAAHHGGRNAPLDGWEETRRSAIQGVYCTGCQVWPVIIALHSALQEGTPLQTVTAADLARTDADTDEHIGVDRRVILEVQRRLEGARLIGDRARKEAGDG